MWLGRRRRGRASALGVGVALSSLDEELPQRQQEGLETVVGVVAVGIVTFMIVWMRRHARGLRASCGAARGAALAAGSIARWSAMAFFAVLREGLETAVFLLAAFQTPTTRAPPASGAVLGIAAAVAIGCAIYRGGVRLNLARFFRITGVVLVLVAAGLVASALHTAHEAGWLNAGQAQALDLTWLVVPGTWTSALLTGMLGLQPQPTYAELIGYLALRCSRRVYVLVAARACARHGARHDGAAARRPWLLAARAGARAAGCGSDGEQRRPAGRQAGRRSS